MTNFKFTPHIRYNTDSNNVNTEESAEQYIGYCLKTVNGKLCDIDEDYKVTHRTMVINGEELHCLCSVCENSNYEETCYALPKDFTKQDVLDALFKVTSFYVVYEAHECFNPLFEIEAV